MDHVYCSTRTGVEAFEVPYEGGIYDVGIPFEDYSELRGFSVSKVRLPIEVGNEDAWACFIQEWLYFGLAEFFWRNIRC
jgi:hypothetical protein